MTKGQFVALTAALGLATMAGAGYVAYASSGSHGSGAHGSASSSGNNGAIPGDGGASQQSQDPGAGAGVGGATTASATQSAGAPTGAGAPKCGNTDIEVSTADNEGAAGHLSMLLVFTNTSKHLCVLQDYPGAELRDGTGAVLEAQRTLSGYSGGAVGLTSAPKVLLQPDGTASAVLEWSDVPTGSGADGGCAMLKPVALIVTPPNTTQSTTVSSPPSEVCAEFQIHPVLSGVAHTP
jgi:hypothetical protein